MPMIRATWQLSAMLAVSLLAVWALLGLAMRPQLFGHRRGLAGLRAFAREFALVVGVFSVYQHTVHLTRTGEAGALGRGLRIWELERALHFPSEVSVQWLPLHVPWFSKFLDLYYAGVHLTPMAITLVWMWWRHRERYPAFRNTVALTTVVSVLIQMIPVAPPRMYPELGFVDTAIQNGMSMYPAGGIADQVAAMPSLHVAWAGMIAWFGARAAGQRWGWIFIGHFLMVSYVVVATANHWWLDGIAGLAVAAACGALVSGMSRTWSQIVRPRRTVTEQLATATDRGADDAHRESLRS